MSWQRMAMLGRKFLLVLGMVSMLSLAGLWLPLNQSSYATTAAQTPTAEEPINVLEYTQAPNTREEAYEQAAEVAATPEKVLEAEDKEIEAYEKSQDKGLIQGAQELIEKVTGNQ